MRYVALLRGINVGGTNKIEMSALKRLFDDAGMSESRTYINSGNVIFSSESDDRVRLVRALEDAIRERFSVDSMVLLRDVAEMTALADSIPRQWVNDDSMKCDVVFLGDGIDASAVVEMLGPRPEIEDVLIAPGAIVWRVDRANATRSRLQRIVGTSFYKRATVRNCNTVRKLLELMLAEG